VLARQLEDEPGVDRPERRVARHVALLDEPLDLGAREVRVEHEAGALADERLVAGVAQLVAAARRAAVLPDDRAVERLARVAVPRHDGLALVGDADSAQAAPVDARRVERLARDRARYVPDLGRVVLHPPRPREVLLELPVGASGRLAAVVEHDAGRAGSALVDREDQEVGQRTPVVCSRLMPDVEAHITGTVWKIECQIGQAVEEGDTLVILESMKMEMPVEAEDGGTVKQIVCEEGQSVSEGDTLVVLE
jgi:acetyl-CoA carboxylase biotin carboxyl carrier protein